MLLTSYPVIAQAVRGMEPRVEHVVMWWTRWHVSGEPQVPSGFLWYHSKPSLRSP